MLFSHSPLFLSESTMAEGAATAIVPVSSGLVIDGQPIAGPDGVHGDATVANEIFANLERQWSWGTHVTKYLREELECETIHDLLNAFKSEQDWTDFYRADLKDDAGKQISRTRRSRVSQCHEKLIKTQKQAADIKAKGEEAVDFDKPLGSEKLKKMHEAFWNRHRLTTPVTKMPGDLLISRLWKELDKRFLHQTDLLRIKGVMWERTSETTKKKAGENLYYEVTPEQQQDEAKAETVRNYLDAMEMYMLALAIAGSAPVSPLPMTEGKVMIPESRDTDPSDYVVFPYQHAVDYCFRAQVFTTDALQVYNASQVFTMLKERDREDRGRWVQKIRNEEKRTLGKIFKEVYAARENAWTFDKVANKSGDSSGKQLANEVKQLKEQVAVLKQGRGLKRGWNDEPVTPTRKNFKGDKGGKGGKGGKGAKGKKQGRAVTLRRMNNGTKLCPDFNDGKCTEPCKLNPQEVHKCNGKLANGWACGSNHASAGCGRCLRA